MAHFISKVKMPSLDHQRWLIARRRLFDIRIGDKHHSYLC